MANHLPPRAIGRWAHLTMAIVALAIGVATAESKAPEPGLLRVSITVLSPDQALKDRVVSVLSSELRSRPDVQVVSEGPRFEIQIVADPLPGSEYGQALSMVIADSRRSESQRLLAHALFVGEDLGAVIGRIVDAFDAKVRAVLRESPNPLPKEG